MYCNFRRNNGCNNCTKFVKSTDIKGTETDLSITIPAQTLCKCSTICVCLAQPIPAEVGENSTVNLIVGDDIYPVVTPCINFLYGDQLRSGRMYCFKFGVDTLAFMYRGGERLCPTKHEFTCIPIPPAPVKAKAKPKKVEPKGE